MPPEQALRPILIIDDSWRDAELLRLGLGREGVASPVEHRANGQAALTYLDSCQGGNLPKLIFLDIRMPGMDGFQVLERIRANPAWRDIVIVMLTAMDTVTDMDHAYKLGATSFLEKPMNAEALRYLIAEARKRWLD